MSDLAIIIRGEDGGRECCFGKSAGFKEQTLYKFFVSECFSLLRTRIMKRLVFLGNNKLNTSNSEHQCAVIYFLSQNETKTFFLATSAKDLIVNNKNYLIIAIDAERSEASRSSFKYRGLKIAR